MHVAPLFLDRYTVTNRQYYEFVAAGGYRDMTLWDQQVWPAVLDLVDQTGQPGPAFWQHGRYLPGEEDLPVVGVSWYEAQACARWMGKRLPTDAEWVKAACWPVATDGAAMVQRRFPWGDGLDRSRANLWGSGPNRVVAVTEFPAGASVGGIYQMVGNVWQWNANDFRSSADRKLRAARAVEEHPRRGFRHLLRQPGHLPIRKRRVSLEPAAQYRLPLRRSARATSCWPCRKAGDGQDGRGGCRTASELRGESTYDPRCAAADEIERTGRVGVARLVLSFARPRILAMPSIAAAAGADGLGPPGPGANGSGRKWSPCWGPAGRARRSTWAC